MMTLKKNIEMSRNFFMSRQKGKFIAKGDVEDLFDCMIN
jgi:hypothetical protein